jgi:hypothetical protein
MMIRGLWRSNRRCQFEPYLEGEGVVLNPDIKVFFVDALTVVFVPCSLSATTEGAGAGFVVRCPGVVDASLCFTWLGLR